MFLLNRINAASVLFLAFVALLSIKDQPFLKNLSKTVDAAAYANIVTWIVFAMFAAVFLITVLVSWLIYSRYKFALGEDALKVKHGILNKTETAIPYRQIQNVDLERDLWFQMMGLSRIVILTAGHDDDKPGEDEAEGILPALDKDTAEWLQAELLKRANTQRVVETH